MSARSAGAHSRDGSRSPRPAAAEAAGRHPSSPAPPPLDVEGGCPGRLPPIEPAGPGGVVWPSERIWQPAPRDALVCLLILTAIIALFFGYAIGSRGVPIWATRPCAIHTITQDCLSAEDMARAYGFEGDWRQYEWEVRRLNQWERWPTLHLGDRVIVPDYRNHQNAHRGRREDQESADDRRPVPGEDQRRGLAPSDDPGTAIIAAGRAGRSAESRQPDRLLDRGGPPATAGA